MFDLPVLLVDDEPQMRSLIRVIVSRNGFRSLEAVDGELIVSRRIGIAPNGPQRVLIFRRSPRTVE